MIRLFFLAAGMFAMGCEDYLFAGLLPSLSDSLHTSVVAVAQGCAVFGLAYIASVPLCAFLLSKKSARQVLILALLVFICGNLVTLFSPNLMIYIVGRFLAGLGSGVYLPVAVGAGIRLAEPGFEGRAMSLMWGSNSVGAVVGVPIGLMLAEKLGWQATVLFILALAASALLGILFWKQALKIDTSPPTLKDQFNLLLDRRVLAVIGVTLLTGTGCLGLYSYISQVLAGTGNSSAVAFSLWSIGGLIGTTCVGFFIDRIGKPHVLMAATLAVLLICVLSIPTLRWIPFIGGIPFLIWGAMGWASVTPQQYSLIKLKPGHEAILIALNSSAVSLGSVFGTVLGGLALTAGVSAGTLPYLTALFVFSALVFQIFLIRSKRTTRVVQKLSDGSVYKTYPRDLRTP